MRHHRTTACLRNLQWVPELFEFEQKIKFCKLGVPSPEKVPLAAQTAATRGPRIPGQAASSRRLTSAGTAALNGLFQPLWTPLRTHGLRKRYLLLAPATLGRESVPPLPWPLQAGPSYSHSGLHHPGPLLYTWSPLCWAGLGHPTALSCYLCVHVSSPNHSLDHSPTS